MDNKNNKRTLRNILIYVGIPIAVFFVIFLLLNPGSSTESTTKFSQVIDYFEEGQVKGYTLDMGTGDLVLTLQNDQKVGHRLASVNLFYNNVSEYITEYNEKHPSAKMVQDVKPAQ